MKLLKHFHIIYSEYIFGEWNKGMVVCNMTPATTGTALEEMKSILVVHTTKAGKSLVAFGSCPCRMPSLCKERL